MAVQNYDASALVAIPVQSANYTAVPNQLVPCDLSGGAFTVTLPTAPPDRTGMEIKIVKQAVSPNALTVSCGGSDVFNIAGGSASGTLTLLNQAMRLQYSKTGAIWYVVSTDVPLSQLDSRYISTSAITTVVEYTTTQSGVAVPAGITGVWIESLIGPGGGGGSGRKGAAGSVRCGGGGGGAGGVINDLWVPVALLGSTFSVTLPAGGTGGAAVTANDTNGNAGGAPASAIFTSGSFTVGCVFGLAAAGGTASTGSFGSPGGGLFTGGTGASASTSGGTGGSANLITTIAPTGGGAGGGITSGNSASNGGAGGWQTMVQPSGQSAGQGGGTTGGTTPGTGAAAMAGIGGLGAGGGAASTSGNAQDGATATGYGAGGGGGGAALNDTGNSGKGGNGGPGYCRLRWVHI